MTSIFCLRCGTQTEKRQIDTVSRDQCPKCQWVYYEDPKVATGVLIFDNAQRVLLARRTIAPIGKWTYPGGYVDRFEDPDKAAARETLEETGVSVDIDHLQGIYRSPDSPVLLLIYKGTVNPDSAPPQALQECDDIAYFAEHDVPWDELAFETTPRVIRDGFASL